MEPNIEELKNFQNHWSLDELTDNPPALKHVFETIISVAIAQQEQINKLEKLISVLRQRELDRISEKLPICNNIWS